MTEAFIRFCLFIAGSVLVAISGIYFVQGLLFLMAGDPSYRFVPQAGFGLILWLFGVYFMFKWRFRTKK